MRSTSGARRIGSSARGGAAVAAALAVLAARQADGEALFASPPHFLALADRQQVVFFINEPVVGALASRGDDAVDVMVPRAIVDPTLRGTTFHDDESGE